MRILKIVFGVISSLLIAGCSTQLENTHDYIVSGDKEAATETLIEYAQEKSIQQLETTEYKTGLNFIDLLEEVNSNELLLKIYNMKFKNNSKFLYSNKLSLALLRISEQRHYQELRSKIAYKVEDDIAYYKENHHSKKILEFTQFASLYLSSRNLPHLNLSRYWQKFPFERNIDFYTGFWQRAKSTNSNSIISILEQKLKKQILSDAQNISQRANQKEIQFIFDKAKAFHDNSILSTLKQSFKNKIKSNENHNSTLKTQIDSLNKKINALQADYNKAHHAKNELRTSDKYTFKEIVKCKTCHGDSILSCSKCSGSGECHYCDRGNVACTRCTHRGYSDCHNCSGWGSYRVKRLVWDPCSKCYVERTFRQRCSSCCGTGTIACTSCRNGFHSCATCRGTDNCFTCNGSGKVDCRSCTDGTKVVIQKTNAGQAIDHKISSIGNQLSSLRRKLSSNNQTKNQNTSKNRILKSFL